ncbi:hypothetical protein GQ53DRAFT_742997 [Thozetella sp. PMI_491]|nr:hypothetical protein GQ53DRAFT_742997 [Thozetella sp. PMI_491]
MAALSIRDRISIAEICFYAPILLASLFLFIYHGLRRNTAWFFLIVFSLIRISGAALQLETIQQPFSIPIYTGALILQNIGISPLMLVVLSLLGRLLSLVRQSREIILRPIYLHVIQALVSLGLILSIVGGVKASDRFSKTGMFQMPVEGEGGLGVICAGYGLLLLATGILSLYATIIPEGERRLLPAVWLSLPFILVRIVYGCLATYTTDPTFNQLVGDANYFLGLAVVMEMAVAAICAGAGLTLKATPRTEQLEDLRDLQRRIGGMARGNFKAMWEDTQIPRNTKEAWSGTAQNSSDRVV